MRELDMTGCKRIAYMRYPFDYQKSICWNCRKPIGQCEWLMNCRPYAGSEYYERLCDESKCLQYSIYAIVKCPHYKGEA